jgi:hypothetical protein
VDGTNVEHDDYPEAPEYVTVELDTDDGYRFRCVHCGNAVDEEGTGDDGSETCDSRCGECGRPLDDHAEANDPDDEMCDGLHMCADDCAAAVYACDGLECNGIVPVKAVHVPEPMALSWANSAGIHLDPESDEITVTISVGDPRGAFACTVRQVTPDEGAPYLIMHTPHPGEGWAHMPLTELHPGTYRVMDYGWTPPEPEPEPVPSLAWHKRLMGRFTAAWVAFWL